MALYKAPPLKNCNIDLLTQEYEKISISNEETIDRGFTRFNTIFRSGLLKQESHEKFSSCSFIEIESQDYYKRKGKSLALKAKVTREQTSDDSDSQGGSDEDIDKEEAEAFNLLARNFCKFFRKGEEPCQKCVELTQKVDSLKGNVSKLQDEALNFSKFKESSIALDDMLRLQKLS
ncbi:hypothetical protein Tco_1520171 [Tanacetum coccineum]